MIYHTMCLDMGKLGEINGTLLLKLTDSVKTRSRNGRQTKGFAKSVLFCEGGNAK